MYFTFIEVENIKCFGERQVLNLSDAKGCPSQWTIILGDNGIGKTTLLQSLIWMRTVEAPSTNKSKTKLVEHKPIMDDLEDNSLIFDLIRQGTHQKFLPNILLIQVLTHLKILNPVKINYE